MEYEKFIVDTQNEKDKINDFAIKKFEKKDSNTFIQKKNSFEFKIKSSISDKCNYDVENISCKNYNDESHLLRNQNEIKK